MTKRLMKAKFLTWLFLLLVAFGLGFSMLLTKTHSKKELFAVVRELPFQQAEAILFKNWQNHPVSGQVFGTYAKIPNQMAHELYQNVRYGDTKYIVAIGVIPVGLDNNGKLLGRMAGDKSHLYLCEINDSRFMDSPPLTYFQITIKEEAP